MKRRSTILCATLGALTAVTVASAAPGTLDPSFGNGGSVSTAVAPGDGFDFQNGLVVQRNGRIVVGGSSNTGESAGGGNWLVLRYKSNGELDPTFGNGGMVTTNMSTVGGDDEHIWGLALQPDGKIVAVGHAQTAAGGRDWALARYNKDGTPDTSFGDGGRVVRTVGVGAGDDRLFRVRIDDEGKIVVVGRALMSAGEGGRNFAVARYNSDGTLDSSFNPSGPTPGIVITPVGAGAGADQAFAMAIDDEGRIVAGGLANMGASAGGVNFALARYNSDGSLDATFDSDGKLTVPMAAGDSFDSINDVAIDDHRIIVGGDADTGTGPENFDWVLARFREDGSPDDSFSDDGKLTMPVGASDDDLEGIVLQPTGQIVVGGSSSMSGLGIDDDFTVARFNADGTLDDTFGSGGIAITPMSAGYDAIFGLAAQGDGKVVASGECDLGATGVDVCVARYKAGTDD